MSEHEIRDERDRNRFVMEADGETATVRYSIDDDTITLSHTTVPPSLEGQGIASSLAKYALETARQEGLRVRPQCPFIASYIERHPEYRDVVDPDYE